MRAPRGEVLHGHQRGERQKPQDGQLPQHLVQDLGVRLVPLKRVLEVVDRLEFGESVKEWESGRKC